MVAQFSGAPGKEFPVEIKEAAQVADPKTQTFQVRVAMKRPKGFTVLPGMTANVSVAYWPGGVPTHRILLPVSAVAMLETGGQVAWVMGPDQTVKARPVQVGASRELPGSASWHEVCGREPANAKDSPRQTRRPGIGHPAGQTDNRLVNRCPKTGCRPEELCRLLSA